MTDNPGLRINNLMNSLGEDGLEGAKARAGNDLSRNVLLFRFARTVLATTVCLSGHATSSEFLVKVACPEKKTVIGRMGVYENGDIFIFDRFVKKW